MRLAKQVLAGIAIIHFLALLGFVGFLLATDRLDAQRLKDAWAVVAVPRAEAERIAKEQAKLAEEQQAQARQDQILSNPARPMAQRLADARESEELELRRQEGIGQELRTLQNTNRLAERRLQEELKQLEDKKARLDEQVALQQQRLQDEGFRRAVELYEKLPAKQSKDMFMQMIAENQTEEVVDYLQAMEPRKAAGILKQFKAPDETLRAVELTERLRERGTDLAGAREDATAPPESVG